ncbi:MAG: CD1845 family protein [Oscillospiraceae bacterium]
MIVLKILAAPVMVALSLLAAMVTFLFCVASAVCELGCIVLTLLSLILFIGGQTVGGIVFLVLAFLVSPFGVPLPSLSGWWTSCTRPSSPCGISSPADTSGQNVPKLKRRRLTTAAVCHIGRRAAYGHDLLQEAQNQQGRNHRAVLERAV